MTDTDIESSASDETVQPSSDPSDTETTDGGKDDNEDTVQVSQQELNDLGEFLTAMREFVLSHEGRLTALEHVVALAAQDAEAKAKGVVNGLATSIKQKP